MLVLVILAVLLLSIVDVQPTKAADAWPVGTRSASAEADLRARINREHYAACHRYLTVGTKLTAGARWRSRTMATRGWFSHIQPGTTHRLPYFLHRFGVRYRYAGEDIGWNNYPTDESARAVFFQFMGSRLHRALIRDCHFRYIGVGSYRVADRIVWTVWLRQP